MKPEARVLEITSPKKTKYNFNLQINANFNVQLMVAQKHARAVSKHSLPLSDFKTRVFEIIYFKPRVFETIEFKPHVFEIH